MTAGIVSAIAMISLECERAQRKHPQPMNSHHEAFGVIAEEFEEYKAEVFKGGSVPRNPEALLTELVQTAAMCMRAIVELC